ncbi:MAG: FAD-dependent thymidylate synthase [Methanomassiliicoccales archaeon PtaU1.Bin124]|nr:MAG: FAD-dependent thymidylate synthase [Methanomassiliicoccales archaeon PtaU1.Bin124]
MKVQLLSHTENAEVLCATAAKTCYSQGVPSVIMEKVTEEKAGKLIEEVVSMGHHSVIEHAYYTFSLEGVSRALTHQLVRHRVASFSQQSQRYVNMLKAEYVLPPSIEKDPEAKRVFEEAMDNAWEAYQKLAEKMPVEDARYVLPNACTSNIMVTMNARELMHFFSLRCCNRAQWEIREAAELMLALCQEVSPQIFKDAGAPCVRGPCTEGKMSCGHPKGKRKP